MTLAPIVLFVYNRPWHTEQTLRALMQNDLAEQSELFIFADGPKDNDNPTTLHNIKTVRQLIRQHTWCGKVHIQEAKENKGLANSIIQGVSQIVNRYGKVIVLEDDIVPQKGFLMYMNQALNIYQDNPEVMLISAYIYPYRHRPTKPTTYFLRVYACWGWATWKRAWHYYDHNIENHLQHYNTPQLQKQFDIEGHMRNYCQLVDNQIGNIYTWAVRWYASWLYQGGYALFPSHSLIYNAGFDCSGEHCGYSQQEYNDELIDYLPVIRQNVQENKQVRHKIDQFFQRHYAPKKLHQRIGTFMKKIGLYKTLRQIWMLIHIK